MRKNLKKGQARYIEYFFIVLFSVIVLVGLIALSYSFYRTLIENEVRQELRQLAVQTSNEIVKLHDVAKSSKVQPTNFTSVLISDVNLNLPKQVAKKNYELALVSANPIFTSIANLTIDNINVISIKKTSGAKVFARTTEDPIVEIEYEIPNIDVDVQGKSISGTDSTLRYYRYNINGTIYDTIILGSMDLVVQISSVS